MLFKYTLYKYKNKHFFNKLIRDNTVNNPDTPLEHYEYEEDNFLLKYGIFKNFK